MTDEVYFSQKSNYIFFMPRNSSSTAIAVPLLPQEKAFKCVHGARTRENIIILNTRLLLQSRFARQLPRGGSLESNR